MRDIECRCGNVFCFACGAEPHRPASCENVHKFVVLLFFAVACRMTARSHDDGACQVDGEVFCGVGERDLDYCEHQEVPQVSQTHRKEPRVQPHDVSQDSPGVRPRVLLVVPGTLERPR